jgi:predicted ATPase
MSAVLQQSRRDRPAAQEWAERTIALATEQGFAHHVAEGTIWRGWALAEQGRGEEGVVQIRQGLVAYGATGAEIDRAYYLALLAEAYGRAGQVEEGLSTVAEALTHVDKTGVQVHAAELYRLKGELLLKKSAVNPAVRIPPPILNA